MNIYFVRNIWGGNIIKERLENMLLFNENYIDDISFDIWGKTPGLVFEPTGFSETQEIESPWEYTAFLTTN